MEFSYGNNSYQYPYYNNASFNDEAGYQYPHDITESCSYSMERRVSSRSDASLYQQEELELAVVAEEPLAGSYSYYQDYSPIETALSYAEHSNSTATMANASWYDPEGSPQYEIKQEPEGYDHTTPAPSNTLTITQIFASTLEDLKATAWSITEDAASSVANGNFDTLNARYITSTAIEERPLDEEGGIRQAIQEVLEHYLVWCRDNVVGGEADPTAELLDEASCQIQSHLTGPKTETKQICYLAILCSLQRLTGVNVATTSTRRQASAKSSEKTLHICQVPGCNSKPFGRSADLDRHYKMLHSPEKKEYYCDYSKCTRSARGKNPFYRHDHFRDHLRDQHKEDLLRRGVKLDEAWWATRHHRAVKNGWWRCSRCLMHRVSIEDYGYTCPGCGNSCELERQSYRESL